MWNLQRHCGGHGCDRRIGQFLDPALLLLLKQAPAHGYTLLSRMPEFGLEFLAPTVIYRALREMEVDGWVASTRDEAETQGPPRRVYALTPLGQEVLRCCVEHLRGTQQVIEYVLALHDDLTPAGEQGPEEPIPSERETPMRIVIPANGADLDAPTSAVFGRCPTFIFVDPDTLAFEALPNAAIGASGGAGVQAAQTVVQHGVGAVIAPSLGPNAFRVIQAAGIPAYRLVGGTVQEVVEAFQAGHLEALDVAGPDHVVFGRGRGHGH
ncbi:MAG: helix-turn-helix transcriptional regulator [Anaerolineae bacterium]|jgi:predicted Fe-Mo cluster-binding NifX family protein/DNA-binding PadR family transcriptional regulator|nr:helix-turn-helix transcriptional regulator [Anaerolineae bacterium]